jgi:hypothetical protein
MLFWPVAQSSARVERVTVPTFPHGTTVLRVKSRQQYTKLKWNFINVLNIKNRIFS